MIDRAELPVHKNSTLYFAFTFSPFERNELALTRRGRASRKHHAQYMLVSVYASRRINMTRQDCWTGLQLPSGLVEWPHREFMEF